MQLKKKIVGLIVIILLMLISLIVGIRSNHRPVSQTAEAGNNKTVR
ncbi:MAG: hypothetical protein V1681_09970 [Candidatus Neomarinimicrobiota bacterium]